MSCHDNSKPFTPSGQLVDELDGHGELAQQYFHFLQSIDPLANWEHVVPLDAPITIDEEYPVDWHGIQRLAVVCPQLAGLMECIKDQNAIAPQLGFRYAWSRFNQHISLLDTIESLIDEYGMEPTLVLEPGCFTGGLLHFLATRLSAPHVGFDVSPISLDVCSYYCDLIDAESRPWWLEADFLQITPEDLPNDLANLVPGGLVLLNNIIEQFGLQFSRYPSIDAWPAKAGVISHWVNRGAVVLLCERHDDPSTLLYTLANQAKWEREGCEARLLAEYDSTSTQNMTPENPVGTWMREKSTILGFFPAP